MSQAILCLRDCLCMVGSKKKDRKNSVSMNSSWHPLLDLRLLGVTLCPVGLEINMEIILSFNLETKGQRMKMTHSHTRKQLLGL